jgi:hypothetical protein
MTALGIALIVCGLTLVCTCVIFPLFVGRRPSSSQETFEESLERLNNYVRDARRTPSRDLDEKSEPTEDVPDDRERRDQ